MSRSWYVSPLLLAALLTAASPGDAAELSLENASSVEVHHLYVSPADDTRWGPDQLEGEVLSPGESMALVDLACASYDLKIVDGRGRACVLQAVELCDTAGWRLTDEELAHCGAGG